MIDEIVDKQMAIDAIERIFNMCEEIDSHLPDNSPDRTGYKMYNDYITIWKFLHQN